MSPETLESLRAARKQLAPSISVAASFGRVSAANRALIVDELVKLSHDYPLPRKLRVFSALKPPHMGEAERRTSSAATRTGPGLSHFMIWFNPLVWGDIPSRPDSPSYFDESARVSGYVSAVPVKSAAATARHEYGHALEYFAVEAMTPEVRQLGETFAQANLLGVMGEPINSLVPSIYAAQTAGECFAESFAALEYGTAEQRESRAVKLMAKIATWWQEKTKP